MLARAVVLQNIRLFASRAKLANYFDTERLMYATLEGFRSEANLLEHRARNPGVNRFTAVRGAGERNLFFSEAEPVSRAGSYQRNSLMWFRRRTQVGDCFRRAEIGGNGAIRFNCDDVAAMPRLSDSAAGYFNQRFSGWYFFVVLRRLPGHLHSSL